MEIFIRWHIEYNFLFRVKWDRVWFGIIGEEGPFIWYYRGRRTFLYHIFWRKSANGTDNVFHLSTKHYCFPRIDSFFGINYTFQAEGRDISIFLEIFLFFSNGKYKKPKKITCTYQLKDICLFFVVDIEWFQMGELSTILLKKYCRSVS